MGKLEEVKNLYNDKYPEDHVENASYDVERDADGAQWVTHARESVLDMLDAQLKEVKKAYIERYACDNTAGEAGCHSDGPCESEVEEVFDLLDEVKGLYNTKYWPDTVDEVAKVDEVFDLLDEVKGLYNMKYGPNKLDEVAQVENLEALLEDVKAMYNSRYSDSVDEFETDVVQNLLEEVKELYNSKYPLDQVDDLDTELEYDEDGALWVKTVREQDVPIQTQQLECLELKLEEVKNLYNDKYPDDHVDASYDVDCDADGAQWVTYAGESVLDRLEVQLKEVKKAYIERYSYDKIAGEAGCHCDRPYESEVDDVVDLLDEVKGLYNMKYWPDKLDEVNCHDDASDKVEELEGLLKHVEALYTKRFPLEVHEK